MNIILEPMFDEQGILSNLFVVVMQQDRVIARSLDISASSEREALRAVQGTFHNPQYKNVRLCGWNSRININKILARCFFHGIPFPWYYNGRFGPRYRYSTEQQLDVFDFLTEYGLVGRHTTLSSSIVSLLGSNPVTLEIGDTTSLDVVTARCLVSTVLVARCDLAQGSSTVEQHNVLATHVWTCAEASLNDTMMAGRDTDAFGVSYSHSGYRSIMDGYRLFLRAFPNIPLVEV